ncbi:hypothetical protein E2562_012913 [Oryza meyeriana var. granulata]|uniref:Uncharacterized protein n=1 Tax=Oryza meyeriana var. granulata TaxID=110450 RepID=A0A6G1CG05_9ORYZ|nr:hypothetical protein E2562_012913 [Oryza meyeriana var. granulata]
MKAAAAAFLLLAFSPRLDSNNELCRTRQGHLTSPAYINHVPSSPELATDLITFSRARERARKE